MISTARCTQIANKPTKLGIQEHYSPLFWGVSNESRVFGTA